MERSRLYDRFVRYCEIRSPTGEEREIADTLAAELRAMGLEGVVHWPGYVPGAELPWWYNAAEAFAYPSTYEGFGIPVAEALACGRPVVTTTASSLPEAAGEESSFTQIMP